MFVYYLAGAAVLLLKLSTDLYSDSQIRQQTYTAPLAEIPGNVDALVDEMVKEAAGGQNLSADQTMQIAVGLYKMMAEGAVLQRNHELTKTREQISTFGYFLSWFMKAEGLTAQQIQAKYEKDFAGNELQLHKKIIESASRVNPDLLNKFRQALLKKAGMA